MPRTSNIHSETYGLTKGETRLLLLSTVVLDDYGKIDFVEIAKRTKVEVATAKTVYTKTKNKLRKNLEEDASSPTTSITKSKPQAAADDEPFEALEPVPDSDTE
ncbi:hypothetical protein N7507_010542 [Penicillium longicatenatum]|nr:hypothetical protein N7507_010542 [Penicillium longicatenatum]